MDNGTSIDYLNTHPECCDLPQMVLGIAEGINYLHSKGIVHSDIKPDNILISQSGDPLLCDFGISNKLSPSQSFSIGSSTTGGIRGTIRYMAKELLKPVEKGQTENTHSKESDIWAFGMSILELITRKRPFSHINRDIQVLMTIIEGQIPALPANFESLNNFEQNLWHICKLCWVEDPADRPLIWNRRGTRQSSAIAAKCLSGESGSAAPTVRKTCVANVKASIHTTANIFHELIP
ncbi:hypothetical protein EW145_g736 [Phellinidium pouzarii]|uniref:mitogen-activated protein kinase kinase n=1 Tax=Phellinidium pouzarii TaxID=167371 RepID=A0A4S4LH71_9AGAM|nr:hypothetical protein EW145_g736 [Phellinidium pouzarii]